jgi:hypothetical protein
MKANSYESRSMPTSDRLPPARRALRGAGGTGRAAGGAAGGAAGRAAGRIPRPGEGGA